MSISEMCPHRIRIRVRGVGWREVPALLLSDAPGLAVTTGYRKVLDDSCFVVTHVRTGNRISNCLGYDEAVAFALEAASIGNWSRSKQALSADRRFIRRFHRLGEDFGMWRVVA